MNKELRFLTYCIEEYRRQKGLSGKAVIELFDEYAVCEYIYEYFDLLHINGSSYIISDIDEYIESRKSSSSAVV